MNSGSLAAMGVCLALLFPGSGLAFEAEVVDGRSDVCQSDCQSSCDDCCDRCGYANDCCCGGSWVAQFEATFFRFHRADGFLSNNVFDYEFAPRVTVGYETQNGFGARVTSAFCFVGSDAHAPSAAANATSATTHRARASVHVDPPRRIRCRSPCSAVREA